MTDVPLPRQNLDKAITLLRPVGGGRYSAEYAAGDGQGALLVSTVGAAKYPVVPTVGGVAKQEIILNAGAGNQLFAVRLVIDAYDIVVASERIINRHNVYKCAWDESIEIATDTNITEVHGVCMASGFNTSGYAFVRSSSSLSTLRSCMFRFVFNASDQVKRLFVAYDKLETPAGGTSQYGNLTVLGLRDA